MEHGRRILEELQRSDWVDDDLEYDVVMAGLAAGRSGASLVARERHESSLLVGWSKHDQELVAQLTGLARAPYLSTPWPEPPQVDLGLIEADFARTTGRLLDLALRWENYPDGGTWACSVTVDGNMRGAAGLSIDESPGAALAGLADSLCEGFLHEEVWGGWPMCPNHPSRPMWATTDGAGSAVWVCEAEPAEQVTVGCLGA